MPCARASLAASAQSRAGPSSRSAACRYRGRRDRRAATRAAWGAAVVAPAASGAPAQPWLVAGRCTHSGGLWCRGASAPPPALGYLYVVRCRRIGIENGFQASSSGDVALAMGSLLTAVELPRALNACPFSQPPCSKISRPLRRIVVFPVPTAVELACATLFLYDDRERAGVRAQGACSSSSFYSKQRASAGLALDAAAGEPTGSSRAALPSRSLQHRRQGGGLCARLRRHSMSLAASASRPAARW
jgi:hypothetical protein